MDDKIKKLEERQAAARAAAKKATADLARARRQEKAKAEKEARQREQAEALEFYREWKDKIAQMEAIVKASKECIVTSTRANGEKYSRSVYDWMLEEIGKGGQ